MKIARRLWSQITVDRLVIVAIVVMALLVRWYGTWFGLPDLVYGDEHILSGKALQMLASLNLRPDNFNRPLFYAYVLMPVYALSAIVMLLGFILGFFDAPAFIEMWRYYQVGRIVTVLFGTATIPLLYHLGKKVYGKKVATLAALFLSLGTVHVQFSHYVKEDVPTTFLGLLSFLFSVQVCRDRRLRGYLLAGFFAGLTAATKYTGALIFLALMMAHLLQGREGGKSFGRIILSKELFWGVSFVGLGFVVGNPYALLDFKDFIRPIARIHIAKLVLPASEIAGIESISAGSVIGSLSRVINGFVADMGVAGLVLAAAGLIYALYRRDKVAALYLAFSMPTFLLVVSYEYFFPSYILPLTPILYLLGARLIVDITDWVGGKIHHRYASIPVLIMAAGVALYVPAGRVIANDRRLAQKDTRSIAREWVANHVPHGKAKIAKEGEIPPIPGYFVSEYWGFGCHSLDWYRQRGYAYLIVNQDIRWRRLLDPNSQSAREFYATCPDLDQFYDDLSMLDPAVEIPGDSSRAGPTIKIYQLQANMEEVTPPISTEVTFGDKLRLRGYDISPRVLQPWNYFNIALYWESLGDLNEDYAFRTTIERNGDVLIAHEFQPLGGFYPTSQWRRGEIVVDDRNYRVPAADRQIATDEDQQRLLYPDLQRGFRVRLGNIGIVTIKRQSAGPDSETVLLALERQVRGNAAQRADTDIVVYSDMSAAPGTYHVWLEVKRPDGALLEVTETSSARLDLGTLVIKE